MSLFLLQNSDAESILFESSTPPPLARKCKFQLLSISITYTLGTEKFVVTSAIFRCHEYFIRSSGEPFVREKKADDKDIPGKFFSSKQFACDFPYRIPLNGRNPQTSESAMFKIYISICRRKFYDFPNAFAVQKYIRGRVN